MNKAPAIQRILFSMVFVLIHYFVLKNAFILSQDLLNGDYSGERIRPVPQYGFYRVPNSELVKKTRAHDKLAGDFAQVYFPSRMFDKLQQNYLFGDFDPWGRPSRYAPWVHYMCALFNCRLDYGPASLVHVYLQLLLFYVSFTAAFIILRIWRYLPMGILIVNICIFLTPAGLSWFERGQFTLYVAIAYLFATLGILKRNPVHFLLGGIFAFIKWTAFPVYSIVLSVFIFATGNYQRIKANLMLVLPFAAIILVLLAWFPKDGYTFVLGLYQQEVSGIPEGISLVKLMPVEFVKRIPLLLVIVGVVHARRYRDVPEGLLPFIGGTCLFMLMYPTVAYEYGITSLLFFIPFIIYWTEWTREMGWRKAGLLEYVFFLFLSIAFCSIFITRLTGSEYLIFGVYGITALIFFLVPLALPQNNAKTLLT